MKKLTIDGNLTEENLKEIKEILSVLTLDNTLEIKIK